MLNPGPSYILEPTDLCLYISLVKEENYNWKEARLSDCIRTFDFINYQNIKFLFQIKLKDGIDAFCENLYISGPDLSLRKQALENIYQKVSSQMII